MWGCRNSKVDMRKALILCFIHSVIDSLTHSFIHLFIHSFTQSILLFAGVTDLLLEIYMDKLTIPPVELDDFGRPLGPPPPDPWESRAGVGAAFANLAPLMSEDVCIKIFKFFIPQGRPV